MITLEDWALVRGLAAEGVPKTQIALPLGISRNTVARAVASDEPPKYSRPPVEETTFTAFAPRVKMLLAEFPEMPASVIAERVGWTGSSSWFRENVAKLRPEQQRVDPADRLSWSPGDAAQCDLWFPPQRIPLEVLGLYVQAPEHEDDTVLVIGQWNYVGRGHSPGEAIYARTIAHDDAENWRHYKEQTGDDD